MADRKKKVRTPDGKTVEGSLVDIIESTERFSEVRLYDGTTLRTKLVVTEVTRLDGQWDNDGNPVYAVKSNNIVVVDEASAAFKKQVQ